MAPIESLDLDSGVLLLHRSAFRLLWRSDFLGYVQRGGIVIAVSTGSAATGPSHYSANYSADPMIRVRSTVPCTEPYGDTRS